MVLGSFDEEEEVERTRRPIMDMPKQRVTLSRRESALLDGAPSSRFAKQLLGRNVGHLRSNYFVYI